MKWEINSNTIIVGDFNTPLTPIDRSSKQKINKETYDPERCYGEGGGRGVHVWECM